MIEEDHQQWLLCSLERQEYEAWLDSQKPENLNEHLINLEKQMNVDEIYPSTKSLKAADLQGRTVSVTIENYEVKKFDNGNKIILKFTGKEKVMVVNKTNAKIIASAFGGDTDGWIGKKIEIYPDKTMFGTDLVDCIRVRIPAPPAAAGESNF